MKRNYVFINRRSGIRHWLLSSLLISSTAGCSLLSPLAPHYGKAEPLDHLSHIQAGEPFGPKTEEDTVTQSNFMLGWERVFGQRSYLELGMGYMWQDSGFHGPRWTTTVRAGKKICFQVDKCGQ